jgi:Ca2+-binding RTX toxin-like protein
MKRIASLFALACVLGHSSPAHAANCAIGDWSRICDVTCSGTCFVNPLSCNSGASDGWCVICGSTGADTIFGTTGDDWICAKGGADTVYTYPSGGSPNATNGNDVVDGSGGDDAIYGSAGNDEFLGGTGNDYMDGRAGRNVLDGGAGDDQLFAFPLSDIGASILCGGKDDDRLLVTGGGAACLDCGTDQVATGTDYDGSFINTISGNVTGSVQNCVNPDPSNDTFTPPQHCGCEY